MWDKNIWNIWGLAEVMLVASDWTVQWFPKRCFFLSHIQLHFDLKQPVATNSLLRPHNAHVHRSIAASDVYPTQGWILLCLSWQNCSAVIWFAQVWKETCTPTGAYFEKCHNNRGSDFRHRVDQNDTWHEYNRDAVVVFLAALGLVYFNFASG